jgi:predicted DNA-binding protein YlxM (UPF0122 family)
MKSIKAGLSNKDHKEICKLYKHKTLTIKSICRQYNISPNALYSILRSNEIELRGNRLLKSQQNQIVKLYARGLSARTISIELNISKSAILKCLKNKNIKTRKTAGRFEQKYRIDNNIFTKIDSKEKAQFLGLIYSDGSLSKHNNLISIRLREDDSDYLNGWRKKLLRTNKPLYFTHKKTMISPLNGKKYKCVYGTAILDITNKQIYNDARRLGLCPNKTKNNIGMPNIYKKYMPYFVLGLFEGDGSIVQCSKSCNFTIACQSNMADDLYRYFNDTGIKAYRYQRESINIVQISNQKDIIKIFNLFYKNPTSVIMRRKYDKYKNIIKKFKKR